MHLVIGDATGFLLAYFSIVRGENEIDVGESREVAQERQRGASGLLVVGAGIEFVENAEMMGCLR